MSFTNIILALSNPANKEEEIKKRKMHSEMR